MGLGDAIEKALKLLYLSPEKVSRWLGAPCNCEARKQKLNALGYWAVRVISGKVDKHSEHLDDIINDS